MKEKIKNKVGFVLHASFNNVIIKKIENSFSSMIYSLINTISLTVNIFHTKGLAFSYINQKRKWISSRSYRITLTGEDMWFLWN